MLRLMLSSGVQRSLAWADPEGDRGLDPHPVKSQADIWFLRNEPRHEISNNVVCATSKASDKPAHMRSLIRAFVCRLTTL